MLSDDLQSCFLQTNEHKTSVGSSAGTSNPKSLETFSVDGCCGEPLEPQHITIDFTPDEKTDTDFIQKKVCAFWKFIENCPEIHKLRVNADENILLEVGNSSGSVSVSYKSGSGYGSKMDNSFDTMNRESHEKEEEESVAEKTAVEMLEFAEDKNLINRIFGAKMPSTCSLGPREYPESTIPTQLKKKEKKKKPVCVCTSPTVPCKKPCKTQLSNLRLLSRELNDWDASTPSSAPNAVHMFTVSCYVLHPLCQRFVRLWRYVQVVSDVLTFFLSMLCCQCAEAVPFSTSSSVDSKPSVQIFKAEAIMQRQNQGEPNEDRHDRSSEEPVKPHHLVIDFATRREDTPEIQKLCQQYWQNAKNQQEHNNMSSKSKTNNLIGLSKTGSHSDRRIGNQSIPAVHTHKKNNNKGNVQIALHSSTAMKYHT